MKYLILLIGLNGAAAFAECQWTVQGTNDYFKKDEIYSQKPQIQKRACAENGAPVCTGYVYCTNGSRDPLVGAIACKAKMKNGKWICPDGQTCYDDPEVGIGPLRKNPELATAPTPPAGPAQGIPERTN